MPSKTSGPKTSGPKTSESNTITIHKDEIISAKSFTAKLVGLMFRSNFPQGKTVMLIRNANWIHTLFMKMPIDVAYLDKNNIVVDIQQSLKPWRFCKPRLKAKDVLEFKNKQLKKLDINLGSIISYK